MAMRLPSGAAPPAVVFVTAYDRYALKAFEVEALDYLLKPFDDARFRRTLARAKEQVRRSAGKTDRIVVRSAGRVSFLRVAEIDWIEAADYYACLHVAGKSHLLRRKMTDLERELDPERFCRIHRSTIVNRDSVQELKLNAAGEYDVVLRDGTRLRMSRRYRDRLK
jgi:two-component system, LytTR family, response regulator